MRARLVLLAAIVASCTFPKVTYDDAQAPLESGAEAAGGDAGDGGDPCDEDNDGYKSTACGGGDCNDHDPRVNPGAGFVTDVPDAFPWGDWNCDHDGAAPEYQYPSMTCTLGVVACNAPQGFDSTQGCGTSGPYVNCTGLCNKTDAGVRTQGCR